MKIKFSRVFLITSICFMLVVGVVFGTSYNVKHELTDISGNRKELDDIAFITQYKYDLYNSKEIIVTDQNVKEKSFVKEINSEFSPTKSVKDNRELIGFNSSESNIYEYKNRIGKLGVYWEYKQNLDRNILELHITEKNLDDNKIESYEISLESYDDGIHSNSKSIPHIYKDELYAVVLTDVNDVAEVDDGYGTNFKELLVNVYKIDTANKEAKNVLSKSLGKYKYHEGGKDSVKFDKKIYTLISEYEDENEEYGETKLLSYNIEDNKVEIVDIPKLGSQSENDNIDRIFLDEGKVYLLGEFHIDEKKLINLTMGEVNLNSENNEIKIIKKELKTSSVDIDKVSSYSCSIDDIKLINDKLYISWNSDIGGSKFSDTKTESYQNLIVADNSTNKVLYEGKIGYSKFYINGMQIVKKEDL